MKEYQAGMPSVLIEKTEKESLQETAGPSKTIGPPADKVVTKAAMKHFPKEAESVTEPQQQSTCS